MSNKGLSQLVKDQIYAHTHNLLSDDVFGQAILQSFHHNVAGEFEINGLQKGQSEPLKSINITLEGEALGIVMSYHGKSAKASVSDLIILGPEYYEQLLKVVKEQVGQEGG